MWQSTTADVAEARTRLQRLRSPENHIFDLIIRQLREADADAFSDSTVMLSIDVSRVYVDDEILQNVNALVCTNLGVLCAIWQTEDDDSDEEDNGDRFIHVALYGNHDSRHDG